MGSGIRWRSSAAVALCVLAAAGCGSQHEPDPSQAEIERNRYLYLDLMEQSLTDLIYENDPRDVWRASKAWTGRAEASR